MKAKTVFWVTCLDCRNNGLDPQESFVAEAERREWKALHYAISSGHGRFVVWERTEGISRTA